MPGNIMTLDGCLNKGIFEPRIIRAKTGLSIPKILTLARASTNPKASRVLDYWAKKVLARKLARRKLTKKEQRIAKLVEYYSALTPEQIEKKYLEASMAVIRLHQKMRATGRKIMKKAGSRPAIVLKTMLGAELKLAALERMIAKKLEKPEMLIELMHNRREIWIRENEKHEHETAAMRNREGVSESLNTLVGRGTQEKRNRRK